MKVILKPQREKPVIQNHPWIFSGAIEEIIGNPQDGDIVSVYDYSGNFLAKGYINRKSQITIRILTRKAEEEVDRELFQNRIKDALNYRKTIIDFDKFNAFRLIHDAGDLLPGLIVDKYSEYLVVQILTLGIDKRKEMIIDILDDIIKPKAIYERSDSNVREKEGLSESSGFLKGIDFSDPILINQDSIKLLVNIKTGQKTGAFLDQRENLKLISLYSKNRDVLDCFCYTGSFSIFSSISGAKSVLGVDNSEEALEIAYNNAKLNDVQIKCQFIKDDAFNFLNTCDRKFDMIILDPPAFAKNDRTIERAARAYKHINMSAMKILNKNGILVTFSCSHHIDPLLFRKIVFSASVDAKCDLRIMHTLHASPDHPINIAHPEGEYLKGLVCYKMN